MTSNLPTQFDRNPFALPSYRVFVRGTPLSTESTVGVQSPNFQDIRHMIMELYWAGRTLVYTSRVANDLQESSSWLPKGLLCGNFDM